MRMGRNRGFLLYYLFFRKGIIRFSRNVVSKNKHILSNFNLLDMQVVNNGHFVSMTR